MLIYKKRQQFYFTLSFVTFPRLSFSIQVSMTTIENKRVIRLLLHMLSCFTHSFRTDCRQASAVVKRYWWCGGPTPPPPSRSEPPSTPECNLISCCRTKAEIELKTQVCWWNESCMWSKISSLIKPIRGGFTFKITVREQHNSPWGTNKAVTSEVILHTNFGNKTDAG